MELSTHWDTKAAQTPFFRSSSVFQPPAQWSVLAWAWGETVNSEEMLKLLSSRFHSCGLGLEESPGSQSSGMCSSGSTCCHTPLFLSVSCLCITSTASFHGNSVIESNVNLLFVCSFPVNTPSLYLLNNKERIRGKSKEFYPISQHSQN